MASSPKRYSSLQNNWADFPIDVLVHVLDRVSLLQDYIRFGAVCKSWYFVTRQQKQRRQRQVKEPPLLHVPVPNNLNQPTLYSLSEGKIYNYPFLIPHQNGWCEASHGWLAIPEKDSLTKDLCMTLINPFSGRSIQLPPFRNKIAEDELDVNISIDFRVQKVILSCDPFLYPDDYVVAVIIDINSMLIWLKSGQRKWNLGIEDQLVPSPQIITAFCDIIFHEGSLYGFSLYKTSLFFIDEFDNLSDKVVEQEEEEEEEEDEDEYDDDDKKYFTLCKMRTKVDDFRQADMFFGPRLVESSKGNILLIQNIKHNYDREDTVEFKIHKLTLDESDPAGRGKWIETKNLENDDVLFLSRDGSLCIPASSVPNCESNSIYYTEEYTSLSDCSIVPCPGSEIMGVFHLRDRRWMPFLVYPSVSCMSPPAWISPTLN